MGRGDFTSIPHAKKRALLQAYATCGQIAKAAEIAGVDRHMHYNWLREDAAYAVAFAESKKRVADLYEDEATRRALGWEEHYVDAEGVVRTMSRHSDTLLIFLMKGSMPDKYRERSDVAHHGSLLFEVVYYNGSAQLTQPAQGHIHDTHPDPLPLPAPELPTPRLYRTGNGHDPLHHGLAPEER